MFYRVSYHKKNFFRVTRRSIFLQLLEAFLMCSCGGGDYNARVCMRSYHGVVWCWTARLGDNQALVHPAITILRFPGYGLSVGGD